MSFLFPDQKKPVKSEVERPKERECRTYVFQPGTNDDSLEDNEEGEDGLEDRREDVDTNGPDDIIMIGVDFEEQANSFCGEGNGEDVSLLSKARTEDEMLSKRMERAERFLVALSVFLSLLIFVAILLYFIALCYGGETY